MSSQHFKATTNIFNLLVNFLPSLKTMKVKRVQAYFSGIVSMYASSTFLLDYFLTVPYILASIRFCSWFALNSLFGKHFPLRILNSFNSSIFTVVQTPLWKALVSFVSSNFSYWFAIKVFWKKAPNIRLILSVEFSTSCYLPWVFAIS